MQAILNFLIKHNHWFLFILLEGISFVLIVNFNNFQRATMFTSANKVVGSMYSTRNDIDSYFSLKDENETLVAENEKLMNEIEFLKGELKEYCDSASLANNTYARKHRKGYHYNTARVVNSSINKVNNFITINKGTKANVTDKMGVFTDKGVVGVTYTSSDNYTVVMPLLNSKSMLSCKVKDNNFCTLKWNGKDTRYSQLVDLPRYEVFEYGDTVVTSRYSSMFPEGIPVGVIERLEDSEDGQSYSAQVKLFVDFSEIDNVYIVSNDNIDEQNGLEQKIEKQ
mgnify:FL=1